MEADEAGPAAARLSGDALEKVAAAFRAGVPIHLSLGTPLYAELCRACADDPDILELASHGQEGGRPMHLFSSVHYLLLGDPGDPLARFYPTITDDPLPPGQAFPDFARYCRAHREEILELLANRTVQTTYVERCGSLMPPLSVVAREAGEPLNLIEIGPSAGVLLACDQYAYELAGDARLGPDGSAVALTPDVRGGPDLHIPAIGTRTGLDLHPLDAKAADERRWLLALCYPELRLHQRRLAAALEIVAGTDMRLLQGDALDLLPGVLAETPSPVCVYHSTCLFYWSAEAKAALERVLLDASRDRAVYRIGIEPASHFDCWYAGRGGTPDQPQDVAAVTWGEVVVTRYHMGRAHSRIVAHTSWDGGALQWLEEIGSAGSPG